MRRKQVLLVIGLVLIVSVALVAPACPDCKGFTLAAGPTCTNCFLIPRTTTPEGFEGTIQFVAWGGITHAFGGSARQFAVVVQPSGSHMDYPMWLQPWAHVGVVHALFFDGQGRLICIRTVSVQIKKN